MIVFREYTKDVDKQVNIKIPEGFEYEEVDVLILPRDSYGESLITESIGKIGYKSETFVNDEEDYSNW